MKKRKSFSPTFFKVLKGRTFIAIDAANLEKSVQDIGIEPPKRIKPGIIWKSKKGFWRVDYQKLKKFFEKHSKLVGINFYTARFNTPEHGNFLTFLKKQDYRLITKPIKIIKTLDLATGDIRKANFDVEISVDAVSQVSTFDVFVLCSGDSDFVYLIEFLKKQNKKTVVISKRGHIAKELAQRAGIYKDIFKLRNEILRTIKAKNPR